jgi:transcriptional regulator with XRE-family HTH domain
LSTGKVKADRDTLRAARVRLRLQQEDIAKAAGLNAMTISAFENGKTVPHESTGAAIQAALEARGIVFTNGDKPGFHFDKDKASIPT